MHLKKIKEHTMKNLPTMDLKDDHILLTQLLDNGFRKLDTKQVKQTIKKHQ